MKSSISTIGLSILLFTVLSGCGSSELSEAEKKYNEGVDLQANGRFEEAVAKYGETISLDGDWTRPYINRGVTYFALGEYELGLQDLDEAIHLEPSAEAHTARGVTYFIIDEYELGIEDLDEAIRLDPRLAEAYSARGGGHHSQGQFDLALEDLNEAIHLNSELAESYAQRALTHACAGNSDEANQDADRAVDLGYDEVDIKGLISQINTFPGLVCLGS